MIKKSGTQFLLLFLLCSFEFSFGTITVNSVQVIASTCPNNGTAAIYASSTNNSAVFLYNIVSGPVTYPQQNSATFLSLYPGYYTGWVHDINSFDSTEFTFYISGNYYAPQFNPEDESSICDATGQIFCNPNTSTGLQPYTWQIISPYTSQSQGSDYFNGLVQGEYTIKMTDACYVAQTETVNINTGGTGLALVTDAYLNPYCYFIGCDTLVWLQQIYMNNEADWGVSLEVTASTPYGSQTSYVTPTPYYSPDNTPVFLVTDTVYNAQYGQLLQMCITDPCGITVCSPIDSVDPFSFNLSFRDTSINCQSAYRATIISQGTGIYLPVMYDVVPVSATIKDIQTNSIVYSTSFSDTCQSTCPDIPPLNPGRNYRLTVSNYCGDNYSQQFNWLTAGAPAVYVWQYSQSCLDSTGRLQLNMSGFSLPVKIEFLSGPTVSKSTKPGFAYSNTLAYPFTFYDSSYFFFLANVPRGNYAIRVSDTCGHVVMETVEQDSVIDLYRNDGLLNNCSGSNIIYSYYQNYPNYTPFPLLVGLQSHDTINVARIVQDTLLEFTNLSKGYYTIQFTYGYNNSTTMPGNDYCSVVRDTIYVPAYTDSLFLATAVALCNGVIFVHVDADSSHGALPFKYEIISGPQTFPPQDSSIFILHSFGTYVIGVIDACGDVDARQVTIDTGRFTPVVGSGGLCAGSVASMSEIASPYYTYTWRSPNGTVFTGNSLVIYPVLPADTGIYSITKIININGCLDSVSGTYHLGFRDTFQQAVTICQGAVFKVGNSVYNATGTYYDTLTGAYGCDSIVIIQLSVLPRPGYVSISPAYPPLCHVGPLTLTATGATNYLWSPGGYTTASIAVNPPVFTTYTVVASSSGTCSVTASVWVYPVNYDTVILSPMLCQGDTFYVGTHAYAQTGNYVDTLAGYLTCDSVVFTNLTVSPNYIHLTQSNITICPHDSAVICSPDTFTIYLWSNGQTGKCLTTTIAGNYFLTGVSSYGCPSVSDTVRASVSNLAPPAITARGDTFICNGTYANYQWCLNGLMLSGENANTLTGYTIGSFTIEVSDSDGCTATSNPYVITDVNLVTKTGAYISAYPNPNNTGTWQIKVSEGLVGAVCEIYDAEGKMVYSGYLKNIKNTISINVSAGMYLMKVSEAGESYNIKLVQF